MLRKLIAWAIVVFVVFYVVTEPTHAAGTVHTVEGWLHSAANAMATFIDSL